MSEPDVLVEDLPEGWWEPVGQVRVVTENSVWLIDPDFYVRMPRQEVGRQPSPSVGGRLGDGEPHPYRWVRWEHAPGGWHRLRILPVVGPTGGQGVFSGPIVKITGEWETIGDPGSGRGVFWAGIPNPDGPTWWLRFTDLTPGVPQRSTYRVELFDNGQYRSGWDSTHFHRHGYDQLVERATRRARTELGKRHR